MENKKVIETIKKIIDGIRIYIQNDGGDLEFISYENNIVTIKIMGACIGCPQITTTFDDGIKTLIMSEIKEVKDVKFIY